MPLTAFQRETLKLLASHRHPDSHAGGGTVINRDENSPRFSSDIDFFHNVAENVLTSAEKDVSVLNKNGYTITWLLRQPYLHRAEVSLATETLRLDWCYDSAFRFFPVQPDPDFGYCLHPADLATNKALALAGRSEIRDYLDILYLDTYYLSLGATFWAACGKDQGFTPASLLDFAKRHMKFREEDLAGENLTGPMALCEIKNHWLKAAESAEALFATLPADDVGCLYLDNRNNPVSPDPRNLEFSSFVRHFGSVGGAWPRLA
jgi:hypothetical protein